MYLPKEEQALTDLVIRKLRQGLSTEVALSEARAELKFGGFRYLSNLMDASKYIASIISEDDNNEEESE